MTELMTTDYLELCVRKLNNTITIFDQAHALAGLSQLEMEVRESLRDARLSLLEELEARKDADIDDKSALYEAEFHDKVAEWERQAAHEFIGEDRPDAREKEDEEEAREAEYWRKVEQTEAIIL